MSEFTDNLRTTKVLLTKFNRLVLFASACFRVLQLDMKARAVRCYITHERNLAVTKFGRGTESTHMHANKTKWLNLVNRTLIVAQSLSVNSGMKL
jgi:hypothetical protein